MAGKQCALAKGQAGKFRFLEPIQIKAKKAFVDWKLSVIASEARQSLQSVEISLEIASLQVPRNNDLF